MEHAMIKNLNVRLKMVIALSVFGLFATATLEAVGYLLTKLSL